MVRTLYRFLGIALAISLSTSCSSSKGGVDANIPDGERYSLAMKKLLDDDFIQSSKKFEALSSSTLNPVLSQLATLRTADSLFMQGRYSEAAEVYREFLVQFSNSPDVPHAGYMRGLCFFNKMPSSSWILPPAESREMADVENAYISFTTVVDQYPNSFYALRARSMLMKTVRRKAEQHLYVARWYSKNDKPMAVIQRLEQVIALEEREKKARHIPDSFVVAATHDNLMMLGEAYFEAGKMEGLTWLKTFYHDHRDHYPKKAEKGLAKLDSMIQRLKARSSGKTP